jgi:Flp pilus assembly protein TadD
MSMTLPFLSAAWSAARAALAAGDKLTALKRVAPVLANPDCPPVLERSARRLAARALTGLERYAAARRHLRAVCRLAPLDATAQYDLGLAFEADPYGCDRRAAVRFRRAVGLRPTDGRFRAALGRALVRCGKPNAGVRELVAAAAVSPSDSHVLKVVVDGLTAAGKVRAAQRLLDRAAFLAPASTEVRRLRQQVRLTLSARAVRRPEMELPAMLRFVPAGRPLRIYGAEVRQDAGSRQGPHFARLSLHRGRT